jgi:NitT/TauT family transport system substrate-binding protein
MQRLTRALMSGFAITAALLGLASPALPQAAGDRITIGLPGIPPVFIAVQAYVAQDQKLFDKYGVKVDLRPFDSGAAAARAVVAGDIALSVSPTPLLVTMISNANVELVGIYGYPKPDWQLGSMDPSKTKCEDVKGQPVGVDSIGGARSIALNQMLRKCNLSATDTQQIALSSNVGGAMVGGQIPFGVLHIDDVPVIEREAKKKVGIVIDLNDVTPVNHYLVLATTRDRVQKQKDSLVKVIAALIEAERFMRNPANADKVAQAAAPTGRTPSDAKTALVEYNKIGFWPKDEFGLTQQQFDAVLNVQKRVGGIREGATPLTFERFANQSLWDEAVKLADSRK